MSSLYSIRTPEILKVSAPNDIFRRILGRGLRCEENLVQAYQDNYDRAEDARASAIYGDLLLSFNGYNWG